MAALPALATAADLAGRLGRTTPPTVGTAERATWDSALLDASSALRDAVGQPITAGTATLDCPIILGGRVAIHLSPIRAVTAVADRWTEVDLDETSWEFENGVLRIPNATVWPVPPECGLRPRVLVTVDHGWVDIPGEILRLVFALAAAQIAAAGRGNLGMTGGLTQIAVDDGRMVISDDPIEIPEATRLRLRAMYGGGC